MRTIYMFQHTRGSTMSQSVGTFVRSVALGALVSLALPFSASAQTTAVDSTPPAATSGTTSAAPLPGVDRELDERVKRVASRLRCPVCQGESIQDSPAELAMQMKLLVREQLWEGKSEDQVLDYFMGRYGQWIMLEPRAEGFNLIVYWLPVLFLVFGGAAIWMAVKRWTVTPAPPSA